MANVLTSIRLICSIALLFCETFSMSFYTLYLIAGVTDMIDGTVARKLGTESEFGAKLDTVADIILFVVCLVKIMPVLVLDVWMMLWIVIIAFIKVINILSGIILYRKFVSVHSLPNRITGILLLTLPLTLDYLDFKWCVAIVCVVATFAAIQEGHFIRTESIDRNR